MKLVMKDLFTEELKTKFIVERVHWEPYAESEWYLKFQDHAFLAYERSSRTKENDNELQNKVIEGCIDTDVFEPFAAKQKIKSFKRLNNIAVEITGFIEDIIYEEGDKEEIAAYKLNSIFPLSIEAFKGIKIGKWVTIQGELNIMLNPKRL